jgi:hypothetical protein
MSDNLSLMPPPKRPRQDVTTAEQISQGSSYQTTVTDLLSQGYAPQIAHLMATAAAEHLDDPFGNELIHPWNAHVIGADTSDGEQPDDLLEEDHESLLSSPGLSGRTSRSGFPIFRQLTPGIHSIANEPERL